MRSSTEETYLNVRKYIKSQFSPRKTIKIEDSILKI